MVYKKFSLIIIFSLLFPSSVLFADDNIHFQNKSEEMVKELTRSPVKYRDISLKKRGLKIVEMIDNKIEEKIIIINENQDIPKLKLRIKFDFNSSTLKESSYNLLKELGIALLSDKLKSKEIMINGHTDSDGTTQYNLKLSFDRADSVKAFLVKNFNLPETRLQTRGYGEFLPIVPNTIPENKQKNRRVEFELIN